MVERRSFAEGFDRKSWEAAGRSFEAAFKYEGETRAALLRAGKRYVEKAFGRTAGRVINGPSRNVVR